MATQAQEAQQSQIGLIPSDGFQALEEKVFRTIEMYRTARQARILAEREAQQLRELMVLRDAEVESLRTELASLHGERELVRGRVEKMLREMDSLEVSTL